jgi:hypothetical protein
MKSQRPGSFEVASKGAFRFGLRPRAFLRRVAAAFLADAERSAAGSRQPGERLL